MARRRNPCCDPPRCTVRIARGQVLCDACFARLPADNRDAIIRSRRAGRVQDLFIFRRAAIDWLRAHPNPLADRPSVDRFNHFQRRLLGERDDQEEAA